jgi:hypothetical protein
VAIGPGDIGVRIERVRVAVGLITQGKVLRHQGFRSGMIVVHKHNGWKEQRDDNCKSLTASARGAPITVIVEGLRGKNFLDLHNVRVLDSLPRLHVGHAL